MSTINQRHIAFKADFNGLARDLVSQVGITDSIIANSTDRLILNRAIWDTGASVSCLNNSVVKSLNLTPTGVTTVSTANGKNNVYTYVINVLLPTGLEVRNLLVTEGNLGTNTDMLLGMDIISLGDFTVQNDSGKTTFSFCFPAFETKYDMIEKANKINKRNRL